MHRYNTVHDIKKREDWLTHTGTDMSDTLRTELKPPGGWLCVAAFHVLWSEACVKIMPRFEELAPMFPAVSFVSVRADWQGVDSIAKENGVDTFPTLMVLRGGREVIKLTGMLICLLMRKFS
jgi:hypothetical protein